MAAYDLLMMWLHTMGAASHVETATEIINQILHDVEPRKLSARLNVCCYKKRKKYISIEDL